MLEYPIARVCKNGEFELVEGKELGSIKEFRKDDWSGVASGNTITLNNGYKIVLTNTTWDGLNGGEATSIQLNTIPKNSTSSLLFLTLSIDKLLNGERKITTNMYSTFWVSFGYFSSKSIKINSIYIPSIFSNATSIDIRDKDNKQVGYYIGSIYTYDFTIPWYIESEEIENYIGLIDDPDDSLVLKNGYFTSIQDRFKIKFYTNSSKTTLVPMEDKNYNLEFIFRSTMGNDVLTASLNTRKLTLTGTAPTPKQFWEGMSMMVNDGIVINTTSGGNSLPSNAVYAEITYQYIVDSRSMGSYGNSNYTIEGLISSWGTKNVTMSIKGLPKLCGGNITYNGSGNFGEIVEKNSEISDLDKWSGTWTGNTITFKNGDYLQFASYVTVGSLSVSAGKFQITWIPTTNSSIGLTMYFTINSNNTITCTGISSPFSTYIFKDYSIFNLGTITFTTLPSGWSSGYIVLYYQGQKSSRAMASSPGTQVSSFEESRTNIKIKNIDFMKPITPTISKYGVLTCNEFVEPDSTRYDTNGLSGVAQGNLLTFNNGWTMQTVGGTWNSLYDGKLITLLGYCTDEKNNVSKEVFDLTIGALENAKRNVSVFITNNTMFYSDEDLKLHTFYSNIIQLNWATTSIILKDEKGNTLCQFSGMNVNGQGWVASAIVKIKSKDRFRRKLM